MLDGDEISGGIFLSDAAIIVAKIDIEHPCRALSIPQCAQMALAVGNYSPPLKGKAQYVIISANWYCCLQSNCEKLLSQQ